MKRHISSLSHHDCPPAPKKRKSAASLQLAVCQYAISNSSAAILQKLLTVLSIDSFRPTFDPDGTNHCLWISDTLRASQHTITIPLTSVVHQMLPLLRVVENNSVAIPTITLVDLTSRHKCLSQPNGYLNGLSPRYKYWYAQNGICGWTINYYHTFFRHGDIKKAKRQQQYDKLFPRLPTDLHVQIDLTSRHVPQPPLRDNGHVIQYTLPVSDLKFASYECSQCGSKGLHAVKSGIFRCGHCLWQNTDNRLYICLRPTDKGWSDDLVRDQIDQLITNRSRFSAIGGTILMTSKDNLSSRYLRQPFMSVVDCCRSPAFVSRFLACHVAARALFTRQHVRFDEVHPDKHGGFNWTEKRKQFPNDKRLRSTLKDLFESTGSVFPRPLRGCHITTIKYANVPSVHDHSVCFQLESLPQKRISSEKDVYCSEAISMRTMCVGSSNSNDQDQRSNMSSISSAASPEMKEEAQVAPHAVMPQRSSMRNALDVSYFGRTYNVETIAAKIRGCDAQYVGLSRAIEHSDGQESLNIHLGDFRSMQLWKRTSLHIPCEVSAEQGMVIVPNCVIHRDSKLSVLSSFLFRRFDAESNETLQDTIDQLHGIRPALQQIDGRLEFELIVQRRGELAALPGDAVYQRNGRWFLLLNGHSVMSRLLIAKDVTTPAHSHHFAITKSIGDPRVPQVIADMCMRMCVDRGLQWKQLDHDQMSWPSHITQGLFCQRALLHLAALRPNESNTLISTLAVNRWSNAMLEHIWFELKLYDFMSTKMGLSGICRARKLPLGLRCWCGCATSMSMPYDASKGCNISRMFAGGNWFVQVVGLPDDVRNMQAVSTCPYYNAQMSYILDHYEDLEGEMRFFCAWCTIHCIWREQYLTQNDKRAQMVAAQLCSARKLTHTRHCPCDRCRARVFHHHRPSAIDNLNEMTKAKCT